jgi:phytoene dehydrogenase-like protein
MAPPRVGSDVLGASYPPRSPACRVAREGRRRVVDAVGGIVTTSGGLGEDQGVPAPANPFTSPPFAADLAPLEADAVVIGAGPNGLVAANVLADAGWDVVVLEANDEPGGAVRSGEVAAPGFVSDLFSAFYPLGAASPVIRGLGLEAHGLTWVRAPEVLAHPTPDGPTLVLSQDLDRTAASLDAFAPGDGDAWRRLYGQWTRVGPALLDSLFTPFPPVRAGLRLAARLGPSGAVDFARSGILPVRRMADEHFAGAGGGLMLAGNALHADLTPEAAGSGLFGWLLASLAQDVGFPVPRGGAGQLTAALVARLRAVGGRVVASARVRRIVVEGGRAVGVEVAGGGSVRARRAVLADVGAPALFLELVGAEHLSPRLVEHLHRIEYDSGTVKLDWALSSPVPWQDPAVARAGTVHLVDGIDDLSRFAYELATSQVPSDPFLLFGQMTTTDPTRSPPGTESAWAYTHVPQRVRADAGGEGITGDWSESDTARFVDRMERVVERYAPGFRDRIVGRHVATPPQMQAADQNLVGGAINGGTAQLHQQLIFRPVPGLGRPGTPVEQLWLASSSAHPGGGVHGACGANAARAALSADRRRRAWQAVSGPVRTRTARRSATASVRPGRSAR